MPFKIGSDSIGDIYVGSDKIDKIYVGSDLVYISEIVDPDEPRDFIINVTKQTLNTYVSSSESYTDDKYFAVKVSTNYSGGSGTCTLTYGGVTKTLTNVASKQMVTFGKYKGVDDGTPDTGNLVISGDYVQVDFDFTVQTAKSTNTQINCVNSIVQYFGNQLKDLYLGHQTRLTSFRMPSFCTTTYVNLANCTNLSEYKFSRVQRRTPVLTNDTLITSLSMPSTLLRIEPSAFAGCTGLTSVVVPSSVTTIEKNAFQTCTNITSVTLPDSVTSIGESVFGGCSALTTIHIPTGITTIPNSTFMGCSSLNLSIPNNITTIGESAFSGCTSLTTILPNSITSIGASAFSGCTGLPAQLNIPNVTTLGASAFSRCPNITSVVHNSLVSIGGTAFFKCGIVSWVVEATTTNIGQGFLAYNPISILSVSANNTTFDSRNNCNAIIDTASNTLIQGCVNTSIKSSVTTIGGRSFEGMQGDFTGFVIPANVTSIGSTAFNGIATIKRLYFAHTSIATLDFPYSAVFTSQDPEVAYYFKDTEANVTAWGKFTTSYFTNTVYHSY